MFTPQKVVTKTLSNACATKGGYRVSGIGHRAGKSSLGFDIIAFLGRMDMCFDHLPPGRPPERKKEEQCPSGNYFLRYRKEPGKF
jgi:hypothetical protein